MDENAFENTLERLRRRPLPHSPANIEANVLRRIRLEETEQADDGLSWLSALARQTRFVVAAFAVAALTSTMVTAVSAVGLRSSDTARRDQVSRALGFDSLRATDLVSLDR